MKDPEDFYRLTRPELVQLVKDVLGDVETIREGRMRHLQCWPGARSISVRFVLAGGHILGDYLIPIPDEIMEIVKDPERNPYNSVDITLQMSTETPGPAMRTVSTPPGDTELPEGAPPESMMSPHYFVGGGAPTAGERCNICARLRESKWHLQDGSEKGVKLEDAVTQSHIRVMVGRGGQKPSPVPIVSMAMGFDQSRMMVIEMTPGQTKNLIRHLAACLNPEPVSSPEGV